MFIVHVFGRLAVMPGNNNNNVVYSIYHGLRRSSKAGYTEWCKLIMVTTVTKRYRLVVGPIRARQHFTTRHGAV